MGCIISRKYDAIYEKKEDVKKYEGDFELMGLTQKDIGRLFEAFQLIDIDQSGSIILLELVEYLDLEESSFVKKAFNVFDIDHSKTISFHEFVLSVWDYCTLSRENLGTADSLPPPSLSVCLCAALYAFRLYDSDDSGMIDKKETEKMLKDMYGKHYKTSPQAVA